MREAGLAPAFRAGDEAIVSQRAAARPPVSTGDGVMTPSSGSVTMPESPFFFPSGPYRLFGI
jgi:hypothetical protein